MVIGNPPFLGDKKMRAELGDAYTTLLRKTYEGRVPGGADLVCYWFDKARAQMAAGALQRAGLVATNSIRGGANRKVLDAICAQTRIFEAWSDEPWVNEGAAVRVSLVAFGQADTDSRIDGQPTEFIHADLTATTHSSAGTDVTKAKPLKTNTNASFIGAQQNGPFDVPGTLAREWIALPSLANTSIASVVKRWSNGKDITTRPTDHWLVDFGTALTEDQAALFGPPFDHVATHVKPMRLAGNRESRRRFWWRLGEPAPRMRTALQAISRCCATSRVSKFRLWIFLDSAVLPDVALTVMTLVVHPG